MIQLIRGFKDILPGEVETWQQIEKTAVALFEDFGFKEIRIPLMERTELFARSIGEETDIVEKEMYTFPDRKGDLITLRPEATASIVRAYIQHKLYAKDAVKKFYTIGPMFRRERPQKGRYRQFYQINAEVLGVDSPLIDVQLILILVTLLTRLSVEDATPHINSLGCHECRPGFKTLLKDFLSSRLADLCADCNRRSETNPLRVLDCKVETCREALTEAPAITDTLCEDCVEDFATVKATLEKLEIPYEVDKRLVRGLDYYTRTTFEIHTGALGAQSAVAGGGRYNRLIGDLGGPDIPATGFAIGFDRLAEIVGLADKEFVKVPQIYMAALGPTSIQQAFEWSCMLGKKGIRVDMDFSDKSLKSQMKRAHRSGAGHVLIVGDEELKGRKVVVRNMETKEQMHIPMETLLEDIEKYLDGSL